MIIFSDGRKDIMIIVDEKKMDEKGYTTRWLIGPWNSQSKIDFGIAFIQPNQQVKMHWHEAVEEIFYIIQGNIVLLVDNQEIILRQGCVAHISPKEIHALHNRSNETVKLVTVKAPSIPSDKIYTEPE